MERLLLDTIAKSFIYIRKSKGLNIDPLGTPHFIVSLSDFIELYVTIALDSISNFQTIVMQGL